MRLAVGADHAGFSLKTLLLPQLQAWGHQVDDLGTHGPEPIDFPDIVVPVCRAVLDGRADRGILVCGTGIGACMAANKIPGIRAALCHDVHSAHQSVEHDDANVLCLGARIVGDWLATDLIAAFLAARYDGGADYERRLRKLQELERWPTA